MTNKIELGNRYIKDDCYYCINSCNVKYATLYCIRRTIERHSICDRIVNECMLEAFKYVFIVPRRYKNINSAKGIGKNYNLSGLGVLWKIIAWPLSDISISRNKYVEHNSTTIKELIRSVDRIKEITGIDLNYELGLEWRVSQNSSEKNVLTAHRTGVIFSGIDNSQNRQGIKAEKGFFVSDIYDEPTNAKDKDNSQEEIEKDASNYDLFISSIEREDTDIKGNYLVYSDDYLPTYEVMVYAGWLIDGKIIKKDKKIRVKMEKIFERLVFSNPYKRDDWTYLLEICPYIPFNELTKNTLALDNQMLYQDKDRIVIRAGLKINPTVKKERYKELELIKSRDYHLYMMLRYGWEYEGSVDSKYAYRVDFVNCPRWNKEEFSNFDQYWISMDIGATHGDQTVFQLYGLKETLDSFYELETCILLKELIYDKKIHKPLKSNERSQLLYEFIEDIFLEYPDSKYNPNYGNSKTFNIVFPHDGEWMEGYFLKWMEDNNYWFEVFRSKTHGREWNIKPRENKLKCFIASNQFKLNIEDVPYFYNDIWNAKVDKEKKIRQEKPNTNNSLNAFEGLLSVILEYFNFPWYYGYLENDV